VLLVSSATLLVETLRNLRQTDLGFAPDRRLLVTVETRRTAYQRQGMTVRLVDEMLRRTREISGVRSAAFASLVPVFGGRTTFDDVTVRGGQPPADGDPSTFFVGVTPGYFDALGIPFRAGRDVGPPSAISSRGSIREVVVNDLFAKKFFPGRDPIGQEFSDGSVGDTVPQVNRVVGVVGSARFVSPRSPAKPMFFVPIEDGDWPFLILVARSEHDGATIGTPVAHAIAEVAPGIGRGDPVSVAASIDDALARERISAALATLFGVIALTLVAVGLYGVMLYHVTERTTEIGIRVALGARASAVVGLVVRQSLVIVVSGLAAGVPLAMLTGRAVSSQLYGVRPFSGLALGVAAIGIAAISLVACLLPARRAVGIDPLTALREA
jgi:predicted permease